MKKAVFAIFLLFTLQGHAQISGNFIGAESGYSFQYHICYEIGIDYGVNWVKRDTTITLTGDWENDTLHFRHKKPSDELFQHPTVYPTLASEFYFTRHSFFTGPKLMVSFLWKFVAFRLSAIDYTNTKANQYDLRFTPEIGFFSRLERGLGPNEIDFIEFYYGYNIPLGTERIYDVPGNRFTIVIKPVMYR